MREIELEKKLREAERARELDHKRREEATKIETEVKNPFDFYEEKKNGSNPAPGAAIHNFETEIPKLDLSLFSRMLPPATVLTHCRNTIAQNKWNHSGIDWARPGHGIWYWTEPKRYIGVFYYLQRDRYTTFLSP